MEKSRSEKNEEESTKLETLIELLYTDRLSQYGKRKLVNYIEKQQDKIKELEKGNRSLMESRIKWKNRYYKEKEKNKENQVLIDDIKEHRIVYIDTPEFEEKFISKDKIREIRDKAEVMDYYSLSDVIDDLSKLLGDYEEENE